MAKMKLKRLKIQQYRNVAPGTELVFNDTWNVLLGQNGTGKTTLLQLIAMIVGSDFSALTNEPFAFEYELAYTEAGTAVVRLQSFRQESSEAQTPAGFDLPPVEDKPYSWQCSVSIRFDGFPACWEISMTPGAATKTRSGDIESSEAVPIVNPFEKQFMRKVLDELRRETLDEALRHAWVATVRAQLEADVNAARFDEGLAIFHAITGALPTPEREKLQTSGVTVAQYRVAARTAFGYIQNIGIVPHAVIAHIMDRNFKLLPEEEGTNTSFLKKVADVLGYSSVELTWDLLKKEVEPNMARSTFGNFGFKVTLDDGSITNHELLSYGQKRLLAFFYYLAANPDIAIADELVNGLHYDWIEICLKEIGDRQAFLTSQNPLLLDFLPFDSAEDVQRSFLLCRRDKHDGKDQMRWTNLDGESARSFFLAYETEAQQVSEILRSKGLW